MDKVVSGTSFAYGSPKEERLEWAAASLESSVVKPFIISLLTDSIEVHDLGSLLSLQRIFLSSSQSSQQLSFTTGVLDLSNTHSSSAMLGPSTMESAFVCTGEQVSMLKMLPIPQQVKGLVDAGLYEEAISLWMMCADTNYTAGINIAQLHEACANSMMQKGDFEKAVNNYVQADTDFVTVIQQFPEFVPKQLHSAFHIIEAV